MNYLRERMGRILAIVIGGALLAFIIGEVGKSGGSFFRDDPDELGSVNGEKISYSTYKTRVDQNTEQVRAQYGQVNSQIATRVQENTWDQMVNTAIITKEVDRLGLAIGKPELNALINGPTPSPQIQQVFVNQQTGQFDRAQLNSFETYLQTAKDNDPRKIQWAELITQMRDAALGDKYLQLVANGLYVNSLDAQDDYDAKNKLASFKYAILNYSSIPDSKVSVTDADYQDYYNDHKFLFNNEQELRTFQYVSVNASPSKADSAATKDVLEKLVAELKTTKDDSSFVQLNAETKVPLTFKKKGQLDPHIDSIMFNAAVGTVYGPYLNGGSYAIAKLVADRVGPDSVKARHILIDFNSAGSAEKAKAKADSIKKLIEGGKNFADMAQMYSADKVSAVKGGELGFFASGQMVPQFDQAAFTGKKGELQEVTTQYGVHILQIEDSKGSSKVVKVAVIDKPLHASSATQNDAYNKARSILSNLNGDNFVDQAKKAGLVVRDASDVTATAQSVQGIDNCRDLVRWVYKAKVGDIADQVYTEGDQDIVARLVTIKPKGTLPLELVKSAIKPAVINHLKAKQLSDKFQSASTIDQAAEKAGTKALDVQNIVFANPIIPGTGPEYKVIGAVFGSQPGKLSKPIEGESGVYVFSVTGFTLPPAMGNSLRQREQIAQALLQRSQPILFQALKDKANVKDNRAKFL